MGSTHLFHQQAIHASGYTFYFYVYDIISLCVQVRKQFNNTKAGVIPSQKHRENVRN